MKSKETFIASLPILVPLLSGLLGSIIWLLSVKNQVDKNTVSLKEIRNEFKDYRLYSNDKQEYNGRMISNMNGKLDLLIQNLNRIDNRLSRHRDNNK